MGRDSGASAPPKLRLIVCPPNGEEQTLDCGDVEEFTIGRSSGVDLQLRDRLVSRNHCRIRRSDEDWILEDLGSANGTLLAGKRVTSRPLKRGDEISVGNTRIFFQEMNVDLSSTDVELRIDAMRTAPHSALTTLVPPAPSKDDDPENVVARLELERTNLFRLIRINKGINSELDLDKLLHLIMEAVIELTEAERGFLILMRDGQLEFEVARNFEREAVPHPEVEISRSIAEEVMRLGRALVAINAQDDERFRVFQSVASLGLRSVLCVPLRVKERVIGVVYIDNRLQKGVFREEDVLVLEAFADQAAIAIENARLIRELTQSNAELSESKDRIEGLNVKLRGKVQRQEEELEEVRAQLRDHRTELATKYDYDSIIGHSPKMQTIFKLLDRVIESDFPVLIHGESGTGKELIARAIHFNGPRKNERFVFENCAALPDTLLESELFGYKRGAFTGATKNKKGLLELADQGTLFLDEVGDMSVEMQKKLLRVLQEGEIRPVGGSDVLKVDVRIIAASNKELSALVKDGLFREDLFYRLNVLPVNLPPLRERKEDVPLLTCHFLEKACEEAKLSMKELSAEVLDAFLDYDWPGNVRELENEVRRMALMADEIIALDDVSETVREGSVEPEEGDDDEAEIQDLGELVARIERREIIKAMNRCENNKSQAASMLGISRFTLQRKMEKYELG
ncbi:MAG: sigma 54-interacting transcriptional regulator [Planctomycetota bacterium]